MLTQKIEHSGSRIETGPIQIGKDWPGVFIRGDNALHFAMTVKAASEYAPDPISRIVLENLAEVLSSCDTWKEEKC